MSIKVQAATASQKINLTQALANTKKAWETKQNKGSEKFYLGHNFQLLTNPPRSEDAPTRDELVKELQEIASVEKNPAKKEQIKKLLRRLFKQPDEKDTKDEKETPKPPAKSPSQAANTALSGGAAPQSAAMSSFQASVQAFLAQPTQAKKKSETFSEPMEKKGVKTSKESAVLRAVTEPVFKKHRVKLANPPIYNADTNDFGLKIKKLRCIFPHPDPMKKVDPNAKRPPIPEMHTHRVHFAAKNLEAFGKELGFSVELATWGYYIRDHLLRRCDGSIGTFYPSKNIKTASNRATSLALYLKSNPIYLTTHLHFGLSLGGADKNWLYGRKDLESFLKYKLEATNFYLEGGDYFKVTHPTNSEKRKIFLGEKSFYTALNQMRLDKHFDNSKEELAEIEKQMQGNLTKEQIYAAAREMFAQGLLKLNGKDGFVGIDDDALWRAIGPKGRMMEKGKEGDSPYLKLAVEMNFIPPFSLKDSDLVKVTPHVVKYLAQKQLMKDIFCQVLGCDKEDLHIIPPLDYHLDTFMRPGPMGSMFVQDYSMCVDFLNQISAKADALKLSAKDKKILERYLKTAELLAKDLGPLAAQVKAEIERAGYTVIPTPGIFYDVNKKDLAGSRTTYNVNFMNSVTGFSDEAQCYYCITSGATVGDNLGKVLMDSYADFMRQYDTRVFFGGFDPEDPKDFREADTWWNTDCQAGFHCYTFEQETEEHMPLKKDLELPKAKNFYTVNSLADLDALLASGEL